MSIHGPLNPEGAEAVGCLERLPETERILVWSLRRWLDGPSAQVEVWNAFATGLGAERGRRALRAFEDYLGAVATGTTHRLFRHSADCPCVGRDEADLATFVTLMARDEPAAAAARARRFVVSAQLPTVIERAATLGRLVAGLRAPRKEGPAARDAGFRTLH